MAWTVDRSKVLSMSEIQTVVADLKRKSKRSLNTRMNLIIFRLATCCGLRVTEMCKLTLDNIRVGSTQPKIIIPKHIAKGKKARIVPLTFDAGTLTDIQGWKGHRESQGAGPNDLFLASQSRDTLGNPLDRHRARLRYKAACKVLGPERRREITIHHGRHSFISHALHSGRSVVQVKEAAGHSSLGTTSLYAHLVEDDSGVGNLFG